MIMSVFMTTGRTADREITDCYTMDYSQEIEKKNTKQQKVVA
jgi:hypothetical protein